MSDKRKLERKHKIAHKLRELGVPLEISELSQETPLIMRQQGTILENCAFDLSCGGTGFLIHLMLVTTTSKFAIDYFDLELPWQDTSIHWLEDPLAMGTRGSVYLFPGTAALEFARDSVINHMAGSSRTWSKGERIQGLLLGIGSKSISNDYRHGDSIPALMTVVDQFGTPYSSSISLWSDRGTKVSKTLQSKPRRKLFESSDVEAEPLPGRATCR